MQSFWKFSDDLVSFSFFPYFIELFFNVHVKLPTYFIIRSINRVVQNALCFFSYYLTKTLLGLQYTKQDGTLGNVFNLVIIFINRFFYSHSNVKILTSKNYFLSKQICKNILNITYILFLQALHSSILLGSFPLVDTTKYKQEDPGQRKEKLKKKVRQYFFWFFLSLCLYNFYITSPIITCFVIVNYTKQVIVLDLKQITYENFQHFLLKIWVNFAGRQRNAVIPHVQISD